MAMLAMPLAMALPGIGLGIVAMALPGIGLGIVAMSLVGIGIVLGTGTGLDGT